MRRHRILTLVAVVAALCGCSGRPASSGYLGSVVEIQVDDGSLVPARATGWVGPCGLVVTVAHAVEGQRGVAVVQADGRVLPASVVRRDDGPDLALLRVAGLHAPPLALATGRLGSLRILVRRDHRAELLAVRVLRQLGIRIDEQSGSHQRSGLEFTPALARGDSGAPIVDGQGKVAGVAFATNDAVGYASATSELRALVTGPCP